MSQHLWGGAKKESMNTLSGAQKLSRVCLEQINSLKLNWKKFLLLEVSHCTALSLQNKQEYQSQDLGITIIECS